MQSTLFVVIAAALGLIMGFIQLRVFASTPDTMPFSEHLECLRTHFRVALAALAVILFFVFAYDPRIEFLQSTANAFVLCWVAGIALGWRLLVRHEFES